MYVCKRPPSLSTRWMRGPWERSWRELNSHYQGTISSSPRFQLANTLTIPPNSPEHCWSWDCISIVFYFSWDDYTRREIGSNGCAKFGLVSKVYYGQSENCEWLFWLLKFTWSRPYRLLTYNVAKSVFSKTFKWALHESLIIDNMELMRRIWPNWPHFSGKHRSINLVNWSF